MGLCAPLLKPLHTSRAIPSIRHSYVRVLLNGVPVINSANWWSSDWNVQVQLKAVLTKSKFNTSQVVAPDDMRLFTYTALAVRSLMSASAHK